jgi:hypothetical protein
MERSNVRTIKILCAVMATIFAGLLFADCDVPGMLTLFAFVVLVWYLVLKGG